MRTAIRTLLLLVLAAYGCDDGGNTGDEDGGGGAGASVFDDAGGGAGGDVGLGGQGGEGGEGGVGAGGQGGIGGEAGGAGGEGGEGGVGAAGGAGGAGGVGAAGGEGGVGGGMPDCREGEVRLCAAELNCNGGMQTCTDGAWGDCVGPAETCNTLDDDCDGSVDEDYPDVGSACVQGVGLCAADGEFVCGLAGDSVVCTGVANPPLAEGCNGGDDDCDGIVDEDAGVACYDGPDGTAGVGACERGTQACVDGTPAEGCEGAVLPTDESCDNIDNDCDGNTDEGELSAVCYSGPAGTQGVGICSGGVVECQGGILGACQDETVPGIEICDGLDNDCNGEIDEVEGGCGCEPESVRECYTGPDGTPGVGLCERGTQQCQIDGTFGRCQNEVIPRAEVCDGVDSDCDGSTDEDVAGVGDACTAGEGACENAGQLACDGASARVVCDVDPLAGGVETCNGIDDDCDGETDEDTGLGEPCIVGAGACVARGVQVCGEGGEAICDATPGEPTAETCDGIDNDCNGLADDDGDGGSVMTLCYTGPEGTEDVGTCAGGQAACIEGELGACVGQSQPQNEICDNLDNDCNGVVDDGRVVCVCEPGEVQDCYGGPDGTQGVGQCVGGRQTCGADGAGFDACIGQLLPDAEICDGVDNNCNGSVDDVRGAGTGCNVGVGACAASGQRMCDLRTGQLVCDADAGDPTPEVCDGIDNDCNGAVDDAVPTVGDACTNGQGVCARDGALFCNPEAAEVQCDAVPGRGTLEVCDRLDNNCNGEIDDTGGPCADLVPGIRQNVSMRAITARGYVQCYSGNYGQAGVDLAGILEACQGDDMLTACRESNANNFALVAEGARHEVLTDVGRERTAAHEHNGVNWYFNDAWSWGFAPAGLPVSRSNCDVAGEQPELRMCWHTSAGNLSSGFRCGDNSLNGAADWTRTIYVRSAKACGDGNIDAGETCDDGNTNNDDGCDEDCALEARCGDGTLDDGEQCDDGNNAGGDGCSAQCTLEQVPFVSGIQRDVPEADVLARGFRICAVSGYGTRQELDGLLAECGGTDMMIACRPVNSPTLTLAAEGLSTEVLRDVGDVATASHQHNDVTWYFSRSSSWGFAPANSPVRRNSCDTEVGSGESRMCWHTGAGANGDEIRTGYRCGNEFSFNDEWERVVYVRDTPDECRNYTLLDEGTRNTADDSNSPTRCDRDDLEQGWYRFGGAAGTQMPQVAPPISSCGTDAPGWLNGTHPTPGQLVARQACYHFDGNTCNWSNDIQVRNCGGYFVYNLAPNALCNLRYCGTDVADFAGIRQNVPEAELREGNFTPCFSRPYNVALNAAGIGRVCRNDVVALACRQNGSATFDVVAMGDRDTVLTLGAAQPGGVFEHNGSQWYSALQAAIGFFPLGQAISGGPCDVEAGDNRLCWHTEGSGGYRCGAEQGLNNAADWERVVLQRGGGVVGD